jgi:hypothetical protein
MKEIILANYTEFKLEYEQLLQTGEITSTRIPHYPLSKFEYSSTFLSGFIKRNKFSYRRAGSLRRPNIDNPSSTIFEQTNEE